MNQDIAYNIIQKVFKMVFEEDSTYTLEEVLEKFAFDVKLPQKVNDSITEEETWAASINPIQYITMNNMEKRDKEEGWMMEKVEISSLEELISLWQKVNYTTTERVTDSINVLESDTIYGCENVYRSLNCSDCQNIVFCDSCGTSEYLIASQRSGSSNFCIRTDDSVNCSNCYNVLYSNKVSNSFFIQDCFNLHECLFCSHIANKKFCICNMQFEEEEYFLIKKEIIYWILHS